MSNRVHAQQARSSSCPPRLIMVVLSFTLLILCFLPAQAGPSGINHTRRRDIAYQPFLNRDGYVQAWNINFFGNGYSIFVTYLISNIGPGSLNNGVSLVIRQGKKTRIGTAEFAQQSLKGKRGRLNLKMGDRNSLIYKKGAYYLKTGINDTSLELKLVPYRPGIRLSGGRMAVGSGKGDFLQADVPVVAGWATGVLVIDKKRIRLSGSGGMEHILANRSPHKYAKRFTLVRSMHGKKSILVGGIHKKSGGYALNAAYMEKGRLIKTGKIIKYRISKSRKDNFSGYTLPLSTVYYLSGPGKCRITETRLSYRGGYYILRQVSAFLRFVLRVFFAKPYILHYRSRVVFTCADLKRKSPPAKTAKLKEVKATTVQNKPEPAEPADKKTPFRAVLSTITSYYLINP